MRLYELTEAYKNIWDLVEDGDVDPQALEATLKQVEEDINAKAGNIAKLIKSIEAEAQVIRLEEKRLSDRRRALENKKDCIKRYLEEQLASAGIDKVKTPLFTVSIQNNSPSVELIDESLIPEKYVVITRTFAKKEILEAVKNGEDIPGAVMKQTRSLRIK